MKLRKSNAELNGRVNGRSNNSFNRSGISLDVIANSDASLNISRPVNSGVGPLRIKTEAELNGLEREAYGEH
ncbi:MAG TPA: hypothetical protein VF708_05550 [Pyrinomonadaceae bacterium]|jgi:hypothetical protein